MRVEVDQGVGVSVKTVGELRKMTAWPENLAITTPQERHPESAIRQGQRRETPLAETVRVFELASFTDARRRRSALQWRRGVPEFKRDLGETEAARMEATRATARLPGSDRVTRSSSPP